MSKSLSWTDKARRQTPLTSFLKFMTFYNFYKCCWHLYKDKITNEYLGNAQYLNNNNDGWISERDLWFLEPFQTVISKITQEYFDKFFNNNDWIFERVKQRQDRELFNTPVCLAIYCLISSGWAIRRELPNKWRGDCTFLKIFYTHLGISTEAYF